jgi:hypothetical protein
MQNIDYRLQVEYSFIFSALEDAQKSTLMMFTK